MTAPALTIGGLTPEQAARRRAEEIAAMSPATLMMYHTGGKLIPPAHLYYLDEALLLLIYGDTDILIAQMPPGAAKSTYLSQYTPAWFLGRHPDKHVMNVSYGTDFAATWGAKARDTLREVGPRVFGVRVDAKRSSEAEWHLSKNKGVMYSIGVDASGTGKRADLLTCDDLYKNAADAASESYRNVLIDFMTDVAFGRLNPGGKMVFIGYPWNLRSIYYWIEERARAAGKKVQIIKIPALAEANDELGRPVGASYWPDRFPVSLLEQTRVLVGPHTWAAQYQQNPIPEEGASFQPQWWRYWWSGGPQDPTVPNSGPIWLSVDCSFKDLNSSDFVVIQAWRQVRDEFFLLDMVRRRLDFTGTKEAIKSMHLRWQPRYVLVEDSANGPAVISALRGEISGLIPVKVKGSKVARAAAVTDLVKDGRVFIPREIDKPWVAAFISETTAFPNGEHDDIVDALSQYLKYFVGTHRAAVAAEEPVVRSARAIPREEDRPKPQRDPHFGVDDEARWKVAVA